MYRPAVHRVVFASGVSSIVTQLLVIREFLVLFRGNEFVIALIIFNWLLLGSIGTGIAGYLVNKVSLSRTGLALVSFFLAVLAGAQFPVIRLMRDMVFIHGSSVGFYQTYFYILLTIAPYCLLLGFALPYSLYLIRKYEPDYSGAKAYMADNLGDVCGGALFTFLLVFWTKPLQAILLSSMLLLVVTPFLFDDRRRRRIFSGAALVGFLILTGFAVFEKRSLEPPHGEIVHYQESRFGRIEVLRDQEQYTLIVDGIPMFSGWNVSRAEEVVHYPLAQIARVKNVLLISSEGGVLRELEKHHPDTIDYVELDPAVSSVLFRYGLIRTIPGLNVINQDGREWLASSDKMYDAIIMNLPEPETYQINRYFTDNFFALAKRRLTPGGILSFSMSGYDNYLAESQRRKLSLVHDTAKNSFTHVLLLPGLNVSFLCRSEPVSRDIPGLLADKGIKTDYISNYFPGNLTEERIDYLAGEIRRTGELNSDLNPRLMRMMFAQWFSRFQESPVVFIAGFVMLLLLYLVRISRGEFVLFSTGFMVMGCEILVIFVFQIYYGYIYSQIGLIVTVFLAGLLPGAWYGERSRKGPQQLLAVLDLFLIMVMICFGLALGNVSERLPVLFLLLFGLVVSFVCGCQFPAALHLGDGGRTVVVRSFSADLVGAACGTLLTSVLLIPFFGIQGTVAALVGLKALSLMIMRFA